MIIKLASISFVQKLSMALVLGLMFFSLSACDLATNALKADREAGMEMQDYKDGLAPRMSDTDEDQAASEPGTIPELQPYLADSSERMKAMPLVSVSVNQSVPIRDVLFELANQADYDIELDPNIKGSIIFTARERPFDEVVKRISEISGLRYNFDNDVLRVELDTPYNKTYKIDYLSYIRSNRSSMRNNVAVVSGEGADTGSSYDTSAESESNFWGELETNLDQIVRKFQTGALKTKRDPRITATEQNPNVQPVAPDADGNIQVQPPQASLQVSSLPDDVEDPSGSASGQPDVDMPTFTLNKQAGLINVYASEKAHEEIGAYLKLLKRAVTAQVLIEAKVLEVTLNDEHATGIDWSVLNVLSGEVTLDFLTNGTSRSAASLVPNTSGGIGGRTVAGASNFVMGYTGNDVQALIQAVSGFGTVRALASPRLTVLNNQSAVLNVATNRVYFDIDIDVTSDDGVTTTDITSDIKNVPEGVLVNVQPSINLDDRTISMAVRPTITRIVTSKPDPAVQYVTAINDIDGVENLVPELNVQELDSVIQARSGQPVVMGGLLQDRITNADTGVPVISETPLFGNLFKKHNNTIQKTELVIFLKATILDSPSESVHNTDKDLYRQFSSDRRPLRF